MERPPWQFFLKALTLSVCLFFCLFCLVCLSACPTVCPPGRLSLWASECRLFDWRILFNFSSRLVLGLTRSTSFSSRSRLGLKNPSLAHGYCKPIVLYILTYLQTHFALHSYLLTNPFYFTFLFTYKPI